MENLYNEKLGFLKNVIDRSNYMVCLFGVGIGSHCGCTNYRNEADSYEIEAKYGYSPDEMFNVTFFNTREEQFYEFYKNDMINNLGTLDEGLYCLKKLEDRGKLRCIITRDIFSLAKRAGCRNVYELHGSVYKNTCPHCGREYSVEYIRSSKGIPRCENCQTVIRPGVSMVGEIVDNRLISKAAEEVRRADTLLVLGSTLKASLTNTFLRYFEGKELVLINDKEHFADSKADLVIHANPVEVLRHLEY